MHHLYIILAVNGLGSIWYHFTGHHGPSNMDQWAELLLSMLALPLLLDEMIWASWTTTKENSAAAAPGLRTTLTLADLRGVLFIPCACVRRLTITFLKA